MSRKVNGKHGGDIAALIVERRKLIAEWKVQRRAQAKIERRVDELTTKLARITGLEPLLEFVEGRRAGDQ
jgi:hypothetical protein